MIKVIGRKWLIVMFTTIGFTTMAKTTTSDVTITFQVNGNAACKSNIEALLLNDDVQGITSAVWDTTTHNITIIYNPSILKEDILYFYIAEGGYDTEKLRAKNTHYDVLPTECKYEREPDNN
jgi:hypothetical protein